MSITQIAKGMAVGCVASVAVVASVALLVAARLGDVREMQIHHCNCMYNAVRRIHISLMQCDNYRRLFPEERADEIRSVVTFVVKSMATQIDEIYQKNAIESALNNLINICSEEIS